MEVKLDKATFRVTFNEGDDEFTGDCSWEVNRKQLGDLYKESEFALDDFNDPDEWMVHFDDDDEEQTVYPGSADSLIVFLAAASQAKPAVYEISYHGVSYWFFHDLIHAEYDSGDGSSIYIDQDSEERALPMGGKLAAQHGVSISEILGEIAKAQAEFEGRFGYEFNAIKAFLDSVELVMKQ